MGLASASSSLSLSLSSQTVMKHHRGGCVHSASDGERFRRDQKQQQQKQILICNNGRRRLERRRLKTTTVYAKVTTSSSSSSSSSENVKRGETTQSLNPVNAKRGKILLEKWSQKTQSFAELATVPLLAVTLPQILLNQQNIVQGNSHSLAGISYEGYACGCLGN